MTGLDELIRESLHTTADEQGQLADLSARSMSAGRQIRRRRKVGLSAVAVASAVAIVTGSLAIAGALPGQAGKAQTVFGPASQPGSGPWWQTWKADRVYGQKPAAPFFATLAPGDTVTTYVSGTTPDGTEFALYLDAGIGEPHVAQWAEGSNGNANFGDSSQKVAPDATYLAFESPTADTVSREVTGARTQWLIVAGEPDTTSASYSADGTTWQSMDVQDGIAVLELPGIAPRGAQLRLSDADGQYADGAVVTP